MHCIWASVASSGTCGGLGGSFVCIGLEFVPPHFPSSFFGDSIIERTKGYGGPVVVESVYAVDEVLLNLPYVAVTVFWAARGICKMKNPKMKIEKFNPWK